MNATAGLALPLGILAGCLHWWLFEKFVLAMSSDASANARRVAALASGRWVVTALFGMVLIRALRLSAHDFAVGFLIASVLVRIGFGVRFRTKH